MADVLLAESATDELASFQPDIEQRIRDKLKQAGENPDHYLERLQGRETFKLKIGREYRAEIDWDKNESVLRVLRIGHRDGFYDS
ncbi:mRNA interferase RelE/StbE [Haloarcula quadrata]|jgi:mRNA interferase RelE/StbE|uniref:Type II toxin-antitoxin system RelE/ParE family toxin n=2 Tax=Haloarcula TaxID=2237 RepID=A0A8T8KPX0_9EURY|nr:MULTISPECIES: type II toxin-antitoxin system RelE/ParE family toxin [Haloarcula]QUJ73994.1 type II toxin-antitoxin system RelE/ParE family toxin [Haloarcula sinaiiensis ATCC 33800]QUJ74802.1 type II toxin-antitoxin system RelE/ParE family toxin [Haloarcula sinaiiensis ATCC 33800]RKS75770.1 mRNA interferase RelE/StbE [Haloarcula quadrata]